MNLTDYSPEYIADLISCKVRFDVDRHQVVIIGGLTGDRLGHFAAELLSQDLSSVSIPFWLGCGVSACYDLVGIK